MPDGLWARVVRLPPQRPERRHRHAGRHRTPDRAAPAGIAYVLRTEVAWRDVPRQVMGCSGIRAWRRRGRIGRRATSLPRRARGKYPACEREPDPIRRPG
ncbi:transposase [Streptomyces sp. NPDC056178]|uniref:transposase n=1 Tax=unclassified Streptomyces TaxID=2593676 RepID=UPI0035DC9A41